MPVVRRPPRDDRIHHYGETCHGGEGRGDGFNAFNLPVKPSRLHLPELQGGRSDRELEAVIDRGGEGAGLSTRRTARRRGGQPLAEHEARPACRLTAQGRRNWARGGQGGEGGWLRASVPVVDDTLREVLHDMLGALDHDVSPASGAADPPFNMETLERTLGAGTVGESAWSSRDAGTSTFFGSLRWRKDGIRGCT